MLVGGGRNTPRLAFGAVALDVVLCSAFIFAAELLAAWGALCGFTPVADWISKSLESESGHVGFGGGDAGADDSPLTSLEWLDAETA